MKFFFFLIFLNFSFLNAADTNLLKKKLDTLKRQTVTIHNDIVINNKELKKNFLNVLNEEQKITYEKIIDDTSNQIEEFMNKNNLHPCNYKLYFYPNIIYMPIENNTLHCSLYDIIDLPDGCCGQFLYYSKARWWRWYSCWKKKYFQYN